MASLPSPSPSAVIQRPRPWRFRESSLSNGIAIHIRSKSKPGVLCSCNNIDISDPQLCYWASGVNRREIMLGIALSTFSFQAVVSNSLAESVVVAEDFRTYTDEANKFRLVIPQDWVVGNGEPNGFKSVTAFYPQETSSSNVSVVISGLGPDFTRMESFGKVEEFADTLVSGLDRSWKRPPGVAAKLIDCRSSKGIYYIEYTLQNPGESRKHLYSAIGMASNGWYNRLYTITGQYADEESENYSSKIEKVVNSFSFI
ncbi:psbP domain-containing protein 3, chloroplastic isoform X2 [Momordica charantia]|uniref:PsbP domain-containing protein 3, chloroplastic isoform X2 n=1 Tax=Momordica charantia TaxID=3673 RepID=A0A6J1DNN6_MOMCH|nr:psbP domain-containing protein 3, chloroplastic isoform X2 [Momordica charantia]